MPKVSTPKKIPKIEPLPEVGELVESDSEDSEVNALTTSFFQDDKPEERHDKAQSEPPTPKPQDVSTQKWNIQTSKEVSNKLKEAEFWKKFDKKPEEMLPEIGEIPEEEENIIPEDCNLPVISEPVKPPVVSEPVKPPEIIQPEVNQYEQNDLMKELEDLFD